MLLDQNLRISLGKPSFLRMGNGLRRFKVGQGSAAGVEELRACYDATKEYVMEIAEVTSFSVGDGFLEIGFDRTIRASRVKLIIQHLDEYVEGKNIIIEVGFISEKIIELTK